MLSVILARVGTVSFQVSWPINLAGIPGYGFSLWFGDDGFPLQVNIHVGERTPSANSIRDHQTRGRTI